MALDNKPNNNYHFILIQTWWHIEDFYQPYCGHTIRQVMDFATDAPNIQISLPASLFGLRGILRSMNNRELPFTEQKESDNEDTLVFIFQLPIDEMPFDTTLPQADTNSKTLNKIDKLSELKRGKIEIEYSYISNTNEAHPKDTHSFFFDTHKSSIIVPGIIQPEFRITPPYGYTLKTEKTKLDVLYYSESNKIVVEKSLVCCTPAIVREQGREKFTFYLGNDSNAKNEYLNMLSDISVPKEENSVFRISYTSRISWSALLMTEILPVLFDLVLLASIIFSAGLSALFTIIAAYIAYACVYVSYLRDGFNLPRRQVFIFCLILMIIGTIVYLTMNIMNT